MKYLHCISHSRMIPILLLLILLGSFSPLNAAPGIGSITPLNGSVIEKYARYEASFALTGLTATNPYFPYDAAPPAGVSAGVGVTVDALLLQPGASNWVNAKTLPCFFYQPVEEAGTGTSAVFLPSGTPEWRMRFTPDAAGQWQYKIRVTDAGGTAESGIQTIDCTASSRRGFVRKGTSDSHWFEFSDGTAFVTPLINAEEGNPLNGLSRLRTNLALFGNNGIHFIRWFFTGEGANYAIYPYGDSMLPCWGFGAESGAGMSIDADAASGNLFSFIPVSWSRQTIPAVAGATYRLTVRAKVTTPSVLRVQLKIGSNTQTVSVPDNGGWNTYTVTITNTGNGTSIDANVQEQTGGGTIRVGKIILERDTTGLGGWGPNLLAHGDPDSYRYVDQRHAALMDEVVNLSEQYGIYHKLTLFHKNDSILGRIKSDGTVSSSPSLSQFYSGSGQAGRWYQQVWHRYFVARWSCSPAIHSVELANENDPNSTAGFNAAYAVADYYNTYSPRKVLISNSFWHSFPMSFWSDARMDYGDEHAYLNNSSNPPSSPYHTHSLDDSALSTRQCWTVLKGYGLNKPVLRGETGVFNGNWSLGWLPDLALDTEDIYDHKKLWAHVGLDGFLCDGQWHINILRDTNRWGMYGCYKRYMAGEAAANGFYQSVGTDLTGTELINTTNSSLRAFGLRDTVSTTHNSITLNSPGRALLWIDNSLHTWRNVVDGISIPPISGTLTLSGLPVGDYNLEWWDTYTGAVTAHTAGTVSGGGTLNISVGSLATDTAVKLSNAGTSAPSVAFESSSSSGPEWIASHPLFVRLSAASAQTVAVDYRVTGGTATGGGVDYTLADGTLTFAPGELSRSIDLAVRMDQSPEPDETVIVTLQNPVNAVVGTNFMITHTLQDGGATAGIKKWNDLR